MSDIIQLRRGERIHTAELGLLERSARRVNEALNEIAAEADDESFEVSA
jgi:hypothetical protein